MWLICSERQRYMWTTPVHANTPGKEHTGDWKVCWVGWREEVSGWMKLLLWRTCTRTGDAVTNAPGRPGRSERHRAPVQSALPTSVSAPVQQVHGHLKACMYAAHVRTWAGTGDSVRNRGAPAHFLLRTTEIGKCPQVATGFLHGRSKKVEAGSGDP